MKTIPAAEFKQRCLKLLDEVDSEGLVITKHGKPVARLLPEGRDSRALIGSLRAQIRIEGDVLSTGVHWEADAQP